MNNDSKIQRRVEDTLNSINNIKRAEPSAFFYARLNARMERENDELPAIARLLQLFNRPLISISVLVVFLVLNIMAVKGIITASGASQNTVSAARNFADEYNLNTTSLYAN